MAQPASWAAREYFDALHLRISCAGKLSRVLKITHHIGANGILI
jgi:hypothetical protein